MGGRNREAVELKEFAGVCYSHALAVVRGEIWPDAVVRAPKCLVAEWCKLRDLRKGTSADDRLCHCEECKAHDAGAQITGVAR